MQRQPRFHVKDAEFPGGALREAEDPGEVLRKCGCEIDPGGALFR